MLSDFNFAIHITAPIFCIIGFGVLFKKIGWMSDEFARIGSDLVFRVTLPCLLFVKLVQTDFRHGLPVMLVGYALLITIVLFFILDRFVAPVLKSVKDRGAFVQGAYRSNMGIIGLAFCLSAFGEGVVATASVYLAILTILFNILAVITLTHHQVDGGAGNGLTKVVKNIAKNPLILSIVAGILVSVVAIPVSDIVLHTGEYFGRMTLPLALLCAGASIRMQEFQGSPALYWASFIKLVIYPLIITMGGVMVGLRGEQLGVLFLMCSSPSAAASYPMAQAMKSNYHLAAAIIAVTSFGSIISVTVGIFLLRFFGLI